MQGTGSRRSNAILWPLLMVFAIAVSGCAKSYVPSGPGQYPSRAVQKPGPVPKGTFRPYTVSGQTYYPLSSSEGYEQDGIASWYGPNFHGLKTANGETYNMNALTCAHKTLPMNTYVRITNKENGRVVTLRVNDRGPFVASRIVDLSRAGAKALGIIHAGTAKVHLEAVGVAGKPSRTVAQAMAEERLYIQVGSFTEYDNAKRLQQTLAANGYEHSRIARALLRGTRYWRVQVGAFRGMAQANRAHAYLKRDYPQSFLIAD